MYVSVDTMGCVYLDVDMCCEMDATSTHEMITITAEEHSGLKNVMTEVDSIQWKAPDGIVHGTTSGESQSYEG